MKYSEDDLLGGKPVRFFHVFKNRAFGKGQVCYELKPRLQFYKKVRQELRPRVRIAIKHKGKKLNFLRSRLMMRCWTGFEIHDQKAWVVDHINGITVDDRIENLQIISSKENANRSKAFKENNRLSPAERKRRVEIRAAWARERRAALINVMPYEDPIDIEIELAMQMQEHDFTEDYKQKGGQYVEK